MQLSKQSKLKYINKKLLDHGVPIELNYKILIRMANINHIVEICENDSSFMDVCKLYKKEICQNILDSMGYKYTNKDDVCEIVKQLRKKQSSKN